MAAYDVGDIVLFHPLLLDGRPDAAPIYGMVCGRFGEFYRIMIRMGHQYYRHELRDGLFVQYILPHRVVSALSALSALSAPPSPLPPAPPLR